MSTPMAKESDKGRVPNTPRTTESPASSEAVAENDNGHPPFGVVLLRDLNSTPKKGGKKGTKGADHTAAKQEPLIDTDDDPAVYAITPGTKWESMRKYKNFVVERTTFGSNEYVYINSGAGNATEDGWIARVLEVRAKDENHVYLRVFWMYSPDELPQGRQPYHGKTEVIASNHMEILDAMTVSDRAPVTHWEEKDDDPPMTGPYWRQRFDYLTKKLSEIRRDCVCKGFHNPDKLLIRCSNSSCLLWLHEDCIVKDALRRFLSRDSGEGTQRPSATGDDSDDVDEEASGTIQVGNTVEGHSKSYKKLRAAQLASSAEEPDEQPSAKRKRLSSKQAPKSETWEEKVEGKIEIKLKATKKGEEIEEITGKLIVTDLRGGEPRVSKQNLKCPSCQELLTSS
ncbi:MAG: hypothetical protein Q9187_006943 [Circinaria calcarea]